MPLSFEKPPGTKDILPEKVKLIQNVINSAKELAQDWGYQEIVTPIIEYQETVGLYSKIDEEKLIKFLDFSGKTVILRPEFTTPIARFVSSVYKDVDFPIRLMCQGHVYRNLGNKGIQEINQLDVELIGVKDLAADAEVIALAVKIIVKVIQTNFKVTIGHTQFLKILLEEIKCPPKEQNHLYKSLLDNDYVNYKNVVNNLNIIDKYKSYLLQVLKLRGELGNILEAKDWFKTSQWQNVFQDFSNLWEKICSYQIQKNVGFDLTLVGSQNYYTGLIFNIYCQGSPVPVCTGGRYDGLLSSFGRPAPATGFAINIEDLITLVG
ncbi:MAG: ATP phosphoribosyltransferase regulatory subunit [Clostridia bacterium]|nr:ATP phosphoribosyltransferase regulatory subunit [Clostridia bacterium]